MKADLRDVDKISASDFAGEKVIGCRKRLLG